jgi:proteic killer suppression protein
MGSRTWSGCVTPLLRQLGASNQQNLAPLRLQHLLPPRWPRTRLANHSVLRYDWLMIKSFRDKDTERLFQRQFLRHFPPELHRLAWRKLVQLDVAERLEDLRIPPANRLERLSGNRTGQHSIRINDQWRICFRWQEGDAYDVQMTDYHCA